MSKEQKEILEKIKKLLRLSDVKRGATPAEAATAAAKAQALLLEHNLVMEDIGDLEEHLKDDKIGSECVDLEATYQTSRWHACLMNRISKPLFCRAIYIAAKAGKAGKMMLFGKKSNVEVVKYFYSYLHQVIDQMALEHREGWKKKMDEAGKKYIPDESSRVRIDFCLGAVSTVGDRLDEQYKKQTEASSTSTALVLVSDTALAQAVAAVYKKTKPVKTNRVIDGSARLAGRAAGSKIPLNPGVTHKSRKHIASR